MANSLKPQNLFSVEGRVAVITGGGAGGLGAQMAEGLVTNGAKVYIAGRTESTLKEQVELLDKISPGKARYFVMDVTVEEDINHFVKFVEQYEDCLDVLVNNAGLVSFGSPVTQLDPIDKLQANLKELSLEIWKASVATNAWAPYTLTISFLHMLARAAQKGQGRGSVIIMTTSATQTWNPHFNFAGYISSRTGVEHIVRILAAKLLSHRIRVNTMAPGIFESNATRPDGGNGLAHPSVTSNLPAGRAGYQEDLVATILYLSSGASALLTGARLDVDGGLSLISNGTNKILP